MPRLVSVVLPVYNGEKYLAEAIDSILRQTYTHFELLVIIDGSKDGSADIARRYADPRIEVIELPVNLGLVGALNKGLDLAKGDYIARMDQDDIALPDRFQRQVDYLEKRPGVGVLGTKLLTFGRQLWIPDMPITNEEIRLERFFRSPICHPSAMYRKTAVEAFNLRYDPLYKDTEDWAMWHACSVKGVQMANLPEVLMHYRISGQHTTPQNREVRKQQFKKIYALFLGDICQPLTDKDLELHYAFNSLDFSLVNRKELYQHIDQLKDGLIALKFNPVLVKRAMDLREQKIFFKLTDHSVPQGIRFMCKKGIYSWTNFKYIAAAAVRLKKKPQTGLFTP